MTIYHPSIFFIGGLFVSVSTGFLTDITIGFFTAGALAIIASFFKA